MHWKGERVRPSLSLLLVVAFLFVLVPLGPAQTTDVRMMADAAFGIPPKESTTTSAQVRRAVFESFHRQNPDVRVVNAGGLTLAGEFADNAFLMSMAGDTAPDVFYVNFRQYTTFLEQGFCRPLDDLIARDPEVIRRVNPAVSKVLRSYDGKTYAIPFFQVAVGLYYRRDFFQEAGLSRPPQTWEEFRAYARKLTKPGRFGFAFGTVPSYHWQNFLYQAGGEVVVPAENGTWRATIATPQGVQALEFYRDLVTSTWNEGGKTVGPAVTRSSSLPDDIRTGKIAMWFAYTNDVVLNSNNDLPPSVIGVGALPAGPAGRANEVNAGMWAISSRVKDPKKLEACWKFIKFFAGDEAARINTQKCVELGLGALINPTWLKKFGYSDLLGQVDPSYVEANESLFRTGHPEPYGKNCQQVYRVLDGALDRARLDPSRDAMSILRQTQQEMDQQLLGYAKPDDLARYRKLATLIAGLLGLAAIVFGVFRYRHYSARSKQEAVRGVALSRAAKQMMAFCLLPAVLSVLTWSYYPLLRGLVIAFQDYKILGDTRWVGLDNFIGVFTQPVFYQSLWNSFLYVGLTIAIGFFLPIFLALSLNEIPRFKVLFRTLFYLPAMTSPIVVAFLWRQLYDKTEDGLLNQLLRPVTEYVLNPILGWIHLQPIALTHDWLGEPRLAMLAVVLPGVWAGAGPGSILYLAALKNISEDRYEAADLDGATWIQKMFLITFPALRPIMLINFLGVFIAGFKAMENVFVLTQGGPLNATRTIGLEVWQNAFMFLRFGYATAVAWVMGSILVGFTIFQIRSLLQMRFTTAKI